jgi:membrane protease YdiL (CAAX protease family)
LKPKTKKQKRADRWPSRLAELGIGAGWLIGTAAALRALDTLLGQNPLAAALLGAILADLAAGRAGVRWDETTPKDGLRPPGYARAAAKRLGLGALVASGVLAVTVVVGVALGRAEVQRGVPTLGLAIAAGRGGAVAVREELLYRGLVLHAADRARLARWIGPIFSGLASASALLLEPGTSLPALALAAAAGWMFAILWQRAGGAWAAIGAHAAWSLVLGAVLRGAVLDVTWRLDVLVQGPRATGAAAWIAAALCLGAGWVVARRR